MANSTYMNPSGIADPSASGFSAVVKAGNTVYIAGMVAQDENGRVVGEGDAEAQTRQIWRNIEVAVKAAGGNPGRHSQNHDLRDRYRAWGGRARSARRVVRQQPAHEHAAGGKRVGEPGLRRRDRVDSSGAVTVAPQA